MGAAGPSCPALEKCGGFPAPPGALWGALTGSFTCTGGEEAMGAVVYPERPGETECQYYMKTGTCK